MVHGTVPARPTDSPVRRPLTDLQDLVTFNAVETVNDKAVVFLPWNTIEPEAQQQILNTASMPFVFKHVAVMPDCHYGKGATVGTVLATQGALIPAAVGVDIGCGGAEDDRAQLRPGDQPGRVLHHDR